MSRWIDREYPKLATAKSGGVVGQDSGHRAKPLECMQRAGDVVSWSRPPPRTALSRVPFLTPALWRYAQIFVPQLVGHGTYNVQDSVGVAVEIAHVGANHMPFLERGGASPS